MRWLVLTVLLSACVSQISRRPGSEPAPGPSEAFKAAERVPRQHTLILVDPKGHFGYHVTQFLSNHQHQFIVKGQLIAIGKDIARLRANEKLIAGKPRNGYFSVTSDTPQFLLQELISGERKDFLANIYDGLIIGRPQRKLEENARYQIDQKLFESPMHAEEKHIPNAVYIVFGSYGQPKKTHYLAHLIKGANNYEQVLAIDFDEEQTVPNGALMALEFPDGRLLKPNEKLTGQIDGHAVGFSVTREIYFDKRPAEGYGDY